jgi:class 3 adenylate cyclase
LLLNILPVPIINELNQTGSTKAKLHQDVSVLFTDFVDFTPISKTLSPEKLVYFLNQYFSAFDEILAKYSLEKIKTISDSYMCASRTDFGSKRSHFKSGVSCKRND